MYLEHFGLREYPFSLTPDSRFFFAYRQYQEALNTLLVALRTGEGFIKITGEVGTGKSLLCRKLLNSAEPSIYTAYIPNPLMAPVALGMALAEELGLQLSPSLGQHRIIKEITRRLIALNREGNNVVLCIDEAQTMPLRTMEALRLLTNLETEQQKLLRVVLFGQPELDQKLSDPAIRQLRQRITFSYCLEPLERKGVDGYVHYRLQVAGSAGGVRFTRGAIRLLHKASGGTPRLVNVLAHKALLACFGAGARTVKARHVKAAVDDTDSVAPLPVWRRFGVFALVLLFSVGVFLGGAFDGALP